MTKDDPQFTIELDPASPHARKAFLLMFLLDQNFQKIELQYNRILEDIKIRDTEDLPRLFADIHFFLIPVANMNQVLKALRGTVKNLEQFGTIYKKYLPKLNFLDTFRDHLEHIVERLDGMARKKPLKDPSMLGNLNGNYYEFGGERFHLHDTYKMLIELQKDLVEWNKLTKLYPLRN
jgi:hypothetical protein